MAVNVDFFHQVGGKSQHWVTVLICKDKNDIVAEFTLKNINQPIGVSEYQLTKLFPSDFESSLPTIEEIENQLQNHAK